MTKLGVSWSVNFDQYFAAHFEAKEGLPSVDEATWYRLINLCWPAALKGWDGKWDAHRAELLSLVCAAPYRSCESTDALMQRYAAGLLGAALGCQVTFEGDRPEAVTSVVRSVAAEEFGEQLRAEGVMERAWPWVLRAIGRVPFGVGQVHAPIVAGSPSLALAPLRLHGARVTYGENTKFKLACRYTAADGSDATFNGLATVSVAVRDVDLRGIFWADASKRLPAQPLPKPRDAEGREADIWLCVPGAEPLATDAKGLAFILITQPREDTVAFTPSEAASVKGHRVISLWVGKDPIGSLNLRAKPPMAELRFYDGAD